MIGFSRPQPHPNMLVYATPNYSATAKTTEPNAEGFRAAFAFKVLLLDGRTFTFEVEDWDLGDAPLSDEEVLSMAEDMIQKDRPVLYGMLDGLYCATTIDPDRIVGLALVLR